MANQTSEVQHTKERDGVAIPLSNTSKVALVSSEDAEKVLEWNWWLAESGYVKGWAEGRRFYMHRYVLGAGSGQEVDHKNHNKRDNRRCNIRLCTRQQNAMNLKPYDNKSSQYKGVNKRDDGSWRGYIHSGGALVHLGVYDNEKDAARAYDQAALHLHPEFAFTNFSDSKANPIDAIKRDARKKSKRGISEYTGVAKCGTTGNWRAYLNTKGGGFIALGTHESEEDAARAYDSVVLQRGLDRVTNFPGGTPQTAEEVKREALKAKGNLPTSECTGVCYGEAAGKWIAARTINGEKHYLGRFDAEEEAIEAVEELMRKLED